MKIACIAWGSLRWNPEDLPVTGEWQEDGPCLPIEFARQSNKGRLTLVITPGAKMLQTLWTFLSCKDLSSAIEALRSREGTVRRHIGSLQTKDALPEADISKTIYHWATEKSIDAVVWTNLPPKFNNIEGYIVTVDEVLDYLKQLNAEEQEMAKEYIIKAPKQINTVYRRAFETVLGWSHMDN